jgi:ABC-type uncharacterized transport system permease subunit
VIDLLLQSLPLAIVASVPLLLAVEGELLVQRAGMINLGIEGMMLTAAMTAAITAQATGSAAAAVAGGVAGATLVAAAFGLLVIRLRGDQIVTGTAVNLFALGVTGFLYRERNDRFTAALPHLGDRAIVLFAWVIVPSLVAWLLWRTLFGLRLRAAGENPEALRVTGRSVERARWAALAFEAVLAGIAGAFLTLSLSNGFAENMTAGRGYIALSIVIFGRWKVKGAIAGTALFGVAAAFQYAMQAASAGLQFHLLLAFPYVLTLLILCGVAGRVRAPEALGR